MEKKELIIENAIRLFSQKGYEAVGVQELCDVSGITKPTLYYYFKSKAGVLEYIANTIGEELFSRIQSALTYNHDFIKGLTDVLKAEINFAVENTAFFDLHCTLLNSPENSEQRNIYSQMQRVWKYAWKRYSLFKTFSQQCGFHCDSCIKG